MTDYSYAADIQFGLVDDLQRYANVQRLGLVPSRKLPLIMYLGAATDHETAVFMVDSRLSQGGEGRCVPKASLCTFLELQADRRRRTSTTSVTPTATSTCSGSAAWSARRRRPAA